MIYCYINITQPTSEKPPLAVDDNYHREPHLNIMQRARDFCMLSNKWDVFITPLLSRPRELWGTWTKRILQARCGMQLQKSMFSRHPQADARVSSQRLWKHAQSRTNSSSTKPNPAWGEVDTKVSPLAEELFIDVCWEKQFSSMEWHWALQPYLVDTNWTPYF